MREREQQRLRAQYPFDSRRKRTDSAQKCAHFWDEDRFVGFADADSARKYAMSDRSSIYLAVWLPPKLNGTVSKLFNYYYDIR